MQELPGVVRDRKFKKNLFEKATSGERRRVRKGGIALLEGEASSLDHCLLEIA